MKLFFQFDDFYSVRTIRPIMMPTDDTIALLGFVAVDPETAGAELELNPNEAFMVSDSPIGMAVGELWTDFLDAKLLPTGHMCE
jgi:hypothetical protein